MSKARLLIEKKLREQPVDISPTNKYVCLETGNEFCTSDAARFNPYTGGTEDFVSQSDFDTSYNDTSSIDMNIPELTAGGEDDEYFEDVDPSAYMADTPLPTSQANQFVQRPISTAPAPDDPTFAQVKPITDNPADDDEDDIGGTEADSQGFVPGYPDSGIPPYQVLTPGTRTDR